MQIRPLAVFGIYQVAIAAWAAIHFLCTEHDTPQAE